MRAIRAAAALVHSGPPRTVMRAICSAPLFCGRHYFEVRGGGDGGVGPIRCAAEEVPLP